MFDKKYELTLFTFLVTLLMSGIMSFVASVLRYGINSNMLLDWGSTWFFAFIVAFPASSIVVPFVRRYLHVFLKE